ncbi:unnamed protein product [Calypogeia fissa]
MSRTLMQIVEPGTMVDGSVVQDFKVIGQAMAHIGMESYGAVLTFFGIGEGLQYLAVIAAIYLFVINRTNWRTNVLTSLLVPYIFLNLPGIVLSIFRGEIGYWIAFVALVIKLFFPQYIPNHSELPASLVLLLVTAPSVVVGLRFTMAGYCISLVIGFYLMYEHINAAGGVRASVSQRGAAMTIGILLLFVAPVFGLFF